MIGSYINEKKKKTSYSAIDVIGLADCWRDWEGVVGLEIDPPSIGVAALRVIFNPVSPPSEKDWKEEKQWTLWKPD